MNRIVERFQRLKERNEKGFVVYIGAGDPHLAATRELAVGFDQLGVDVLELGVPFSDPLADGLVNQLAAQRGIEAGATPGKVLATVAAIRRTSQIPIVLYIYYNLLHRRGVREFVQQAAQAGVDGLLALDLPPEEAAAYEQAMKEAGLCAIFLVAPTTPEPRIRLIAEHGSGFLYYVSREGVTGMQKEMAANLAAMTQRIRAHSDLPIVVGFGISTPRQAGEVAQSAEAVVVGSAIVDQVARHGRAPEMVQRVMEFTQALMTPVKPGAVSRPGSPAAA